jgi:PhnB protein
VSIAEVLRDLPRPRFRESLKTALERTASMTPSTEALAPPAETASPRLRVRNAAGAIEFYKEAFGAAELMRFEVHGQVAHAKLQIGDSIVLLGEEAPEYGYPGPEELGGSPVGMHLYVEDADRAVERAVAAGATMIMPVADQFYGDRSGQIKDPFGYSWSIAARKQRLSVEEMHQQFDAMEREQAARRTAETFLPKDFHTLTPYLVTHDAPALIEFVTRAFGAEERFRTTGSAGGMHAEVRVGDSIVMIGGGAPDNTWREQTWPTALHIYVEDADAAYGRALEAGATSIAAPADQPYGERSGGVKDPFGNAWYIATPTGARTRPEGLHTVNPYLHPLRAEPVIAFLRRAFGATNVHKYGSPDGVIQHAQVSVGTSALEMGEAQGPYQPMPTMFYMYVPDADATYRRALEAGAMSVSEPVDQPWGDRTGVVKDVFGNQWYISTRIKDVRGS